MVPASMNLLSFRPEGPAVRRPGRQAGIGISERWSAEGAAPEISIVPRLRRSIFHPESNPGLTAGPIHCRPIGPQYRRFNAPPQFVARLKSSFACGVIFDALYNAAGGEPGKGKPANSSFLYNGRVGMPQSRRRMKGKQAPSSNQNSIAGNRPGCEDDKAMIADSLSGQTARLFRRAGRTGCVRIDAAGALIRLGIQFSNASPIKRR